MSNQYKIINASLRWYLIFSLSFLIGACESGHSTTTTPAPTSTTTSSATLTPTLTPTFTRTSTPTPTITPTSTPTFGPTPLGGGGHLVFHSKISWNNFDIVVANADGSQLKNLTESPAREFDPVWSPDGTAISFVSDRDGGLDLYVMMADGSGITKLTENMEVIGWSTWSPDGKKLAFASKHLDNYDLYVINTDGSNLTPLVQGPDYDTGPAWSPDGKKIAFSSGASQGTWQIYLVNPDGTGLTNLTNNSHGNYFPTWSPDGSKIAYIAQYGNTTNPNHTRYTCIMNADGSGSFRLGKPSLGRPAAWSPDGRHLATSGLGGLFIISVKGGGYQLAFSNYLPYWISWTAH